ncbi:MAG TPA: hypothetical protein VN948_18605 [Terriglobales bacterium]|nr:hypothetical protein [Terriglobales bacterium]
MHHRLGRVFCLMLFSLLGTTLFAQQEFSADLVNNSEKASSVSGKIYASKDKVRFEGHEQNGRTGAMIINFAAQTTDILIPERKMYIESASSHAPGAPRLFNFFRAADVENACDEWQKMAAKPGGSCHKVGSEVVNGRSTVKYQGTSADGDVSNVWLDPKLRFPLKWQGKNGGGELRNIQEGAQPASLFTVPADYQKMDMGNMGMPSGTAPH